MLYNPSIMNQTDFINGSRTTTGTAVTIASGRYFSFDIQLAASQSGIGTAAPTVTFNSTSGAGTFSPATGSVIARLEVTGLIGIVASDSNTISFAGYSGDTGATLDFTASGTSSCVINGFLL